MAATYGLAAEEVEDQCDELLGAFQADCVAGARTGEQLEASARHQLGDVLTITRRREHILLTHDDQRRRGDPGQQVGRVVPEAGIALDYFKIGEKTQGSCTVAPSDGRDLA